MAGTSFLVIGEALVDLISEPGGWRFEATPGGSPLNVAVGLATAGHPVTLAAEVGDDLFGGLIRDHLTRHRVNPRALSVTAAPTSLAFAKLDRAGAAGYDFRFTWAWGGAPALADVDHLHVGSLGAVVAPGATAVRAAVRAARRQGVPVSYDPNIRPALLGAPAAVRPAVEELVAAADLVKVSDEDLAWLYPGTPDLVAAARWAGGGPGLVVVTRGAAGAVALHQGEAITCAAPRVEVVDTVGAGDAFTAALLSRLADPPAHPDVVETLPYPDVVETLRHPDVVEALRYATATAAAVCAHRGAGPPSAEAVAARLPETRITDRRPLSEAATDPQDTTRRAWHERR